MTFRPASPSLRYARRVAAGLVSASVLLSAVNAQAKPEFPAIVKEYAETPCEPPCILCHQTNTPVDLADAPVFGAGRPFYDALFMFGFNQGANALTLALQRYKATPFDANMDGVCDDNIGPPPDNTPDGICDVDVNNNDIHDIEDLKANLNPNDDELLCDIPAYGCGASRIEPRGNVEDYGTFLGILAAMSLLLGARRRRRTERE